MEDHTLQEIAVLQVLTQLSSSAIFRIRNQVEEAFSEELENWLYIMFKYIKNKKHIMYINASYFKIKIQLERGDNFFIVPDRFEYFIMYTYGLIENHVLKKRELATFLDRQSLGNCKKHLLHIVNSFPFPIK